MLSRFSIAFLGAMTVTYYSSSLATPVVLTLSLLVALCSTYRRHMLLAGLSVGFLWANIQAHRIVSTAFPAHMQGSDIEVIGTITTIPKRYFRKVGFEFRVEKVMASDFAMLENSFIKLSWYNTEEKLVSGERWNLTVRLKKPRGLMNPAGFDYEKWLVSKGISATGYVRNPGFNRQINGPRFLSLDSVRMSIRKKVLDIDLHETPKSLILALVLGDGSKISSKHWNWFRKTGTSHLFVISGLHIGLMAAVSAGFTSLLWGLNARFGRVALDRNVYMGTAALTMATVYAGLAGFTVPTLRALIMLCVFLVYSLIRRQQKGLTAFYIALLLVLLFIPKSPLAAGFWLSFLAVLGIFLLNGRRIHKQSGPRQWIFWHASLALIMLPVTALFFSYSSTVSPIVNFICIPLLSMLIVPLALLSTGLLFVAPVLGESLMYGCAYLLDLMMIIVEFFSSEIFPNLWFPELRIWSYILAGMAVLVALLPKGTGLNRLSIPLSAALFFPTYSQLDEGEFLVDVLDVGQGLSVLIRTADHSLLYDTGGVLTRKSSMASAIIVPYFRSLGLDRLDKLVISHPDKDHAAGLQDIIATLDVSKVVTAKSFAKLLNADESCNHLASWEWNDIKFEFLNSPDADFNKRNDHSCVLRVNNKLSSIVLAGDIETAGEAALIDFPLTPVDLLIAPHHGSKTSSSRELLAVLRPKYVFFTVGYRNRYRFPHQTVSDRYTQIKSEIFRSDRDGMVSFLFSKGGLNNTVMKYRQRHKEFWRTDFDF